MLIRQSLNKLGTPTANQAE